MLKKALLVISLFMITTSSSYALGALFKFPTATVKAMQVRSPVPAKSIEKYTNFSGTWRGACTDEQTQTVKITQNSATAIIIESLDDGDSEKTKFIIPGIASNITKVASEETVESNTIRWNTDYTALIINGYSATLDKAYGQGLFSSLVSTLNLSLVDGKLVVQGNGSLSFDGEEAIPVNESCILSKV